MEGKGCISGYRSKLDQTLASPDLTNDERLQTLVRNQILQPSPIQFEEYVENVVQRRTKEVSNFLRMLRSTSVNDTESSKSGEDSHGGWKVKQDTDEFRVMYREGPEGTPFHTLLVEGYVDGPLDVCLCISWESGLYNKWWPQTAVPTFKIVSSQCLQRVRTGEQISLVRMKVSWPLSSREAVIHYFAFEYFQDDLMVVLLNSISDSEIVDRCTHGFTRDGIPDAEEVVRIDVVGGFAFQKVTANRSYFRTIVNMDIKLDFVPPSFINFVSRQLLGSGFKLYKKEVASVSKGDEKFREALRDPFYTRIREAFYPGNSTRPQELQNLQRSTSVMLEDQGGNDNAKENNVYDDSIFDSKANGIMLRETNKPNEVAKLKENGAEGSETLDDSTLKPSNSSTDDQITDKLRPNKEAFVSRTERKEAVRTTGDAENNGIEIEKKPTVSPEVERALQTLENIISIFRENTSNYGKGRSFGIHGASLTNLKKEAVGESATLAADRASWQKGPMRETNQCKIAPEESSNERPSNPNHISLCSSVNRKIGSTDFAHTSEDDLHSADVKTTRKNKKSRFCCLYFVSEH